MKKTSRIIAWLVATATVLPMTACSKAQEATAFQGDIELTAQTSLRETTTETSATVATETVNETDVTGTMPLEPAKELGALCIDVPEENCEIPLLPEEERFHYTMDLELDPEKRTIGGHVVIQFYCNTDYAWGDKLCLRDYSSLFIYGELADLGEDVKTDGALTVISNVMDEDTKSEMHISRDVNDVSVVWINLDKELAPNEKMTISYDFVAKIPKVTDRYGIVNGVYNIANFYPILSVYSASGFTKDAYYNAGECFCSDISDYDVTLTMPKDMKIMSTGVETGSSVHDEKITYTIEAPCVRDFVFSACETFKFFEKDCEGIHIRVAYNEADMPNDYMDEVAEVSLQAACDSFTALNCALGKYPYEEMDIVLAMIDSIGMEYPNLIMCTVDETNCSIGEVEGLPYSEMCRTISHEIGHQWFMGIVGNNSGAEPWLDEALTSYSECIYYEYLGVDEMTESYSWENENLSDPSVVAELKEEGILPINRAYDEFADLDCYTWALYYYGPAAFYQMEEILGREDMQGMLRAYVHRYAFTNVNERRFFQFINECVGEENEEFYALIDAVFFS